MQRILILIVALSIPVASSAVKGPRPLADSGAWVPHLECLSADQLYFAKNISNLYGLGNRKFCRVGLSD